MRPPLLARIVAPWAILAAGCVQTPTVVPTAELAERVAPAALPAASAGPPTRPAPDPGAHAEAAHSASSPPEMAAEPHDAPVAIACGAEPLTLDAAKRLALRLNPQLAVTREAIATAQGEEEIAYAGYLPLFQANTAYQAFSSHVGYVGPRGRFYVLPVRGFGPGTQDFVVTDLQMKWAVWQFGRQYARHGQSLLKLEMARLQYERARQSMEFDVTQAYYRMLQAGGSIALSRQALGRAGSLLDDVRERASRQEATREDVALADAQVKQRRQQLNDALSEGELAVAALNRSIGLNVNLATEIVPPQGPPPMVDCSLKECLQLSVAHRPEFLVVQKGILAAATDVTMARAEFLPTITVNSVYSNVTGTGVQNANVGTGGIFVNLELYTGGRRRGRVETARAEVRTACAQAQQICDGIAYETHVAYRGARDAHPRIILAELAAAQARENLRRIVPSYRAGEATTDAVIAAQTTLAQAEQGVNTSYFECRAAQARLDFATGTAVQAVTEPLPSATVADVVAPPVVPPPLPPSTSPFAGAGAALPPIVIPSGVPANAASQPPPFSPPGTGRPGTTSRPPFVAPSPITTPD